jgi:ribosomal protein L23
LLRIFLFKLTQIEIKGFLEKVYGLDITNVETLNYEGEKKRKGNTNYHYRLPDWKKVYVRLRTPVTIPEDVFESLPPVKPLPQKKERGGRKARRETAAAAAQQD